MIVIIAHLTSPVLTNTPSLLLPSQSACTLCHCFILSFNSLKQDGDGQNNIHKHSHLPLKLRTTLQFDLLHLHHINCTSCEDWDYFTQAHCRESAKLEHRATLLDWQNSPLHNNGTINSLIPLITEPGDDGALAYFSRTVLTLIKDALNLANLNTQAPQEMNTGPHLPQYQK